MYHFSYFKETDPAVMRAFMDQHPFAFLTGSFRSGQQVATQIPILIEERDGDLILQGHFMRNTDHHKVFIENPKALAVFTGPDTYVSASWYSNPQIGSTWNYMSVHVHGDLVFMPDEALVEFMKRLTLRFEQGHVGSPTVYDNLPEAFLSKMMPAIVGFEIRAERIENVFKLSQNRDEQSYDTIIAKLQGLGGDSALIAEEMMRRRDALFPPGQVWDGSRFDS